MKRLERLEEQNQGPMRLTPLTAAEVEFIRDALAAYSRVMKGAAVEAFAGPHYQQVVRHFDGRRVDAEMFRGELSRRWLDGAKVKP